MNDRFPVEVDGEWRETEICFASEREVKQLAYWRVPRPLPNDAGVAQKVYDAVEFARIACNRWRYYHRQNLTAKSVEDLKLAIRQRTNVELAMTLIARPVWPSPIATLGIAYLRRTWCNHLFLEFFASHPRVISRHGQKIRGVGDALLHQIIALAEYLSVPCVWGEATEQSHAWYESHLGINDVLDHFVIDDQVMLHCLNEMRRAREEMLAHRTLT